MEDKTPYVIETNTIGETYDDQDADDVAFLAPRLATYGSDDDNDENLTLRQRASSSPGGSGDEEQDGDDALELSVDGDDDAASNEQTGEDADVDDHRAPASNGTFFTLHRGPESDDAVAEEDLAALLAVSRVRELLKFEGSSPIVAKSAAQAAAEAVVLILRDLTKTAADQATRKKRKTVTYDDVARTAQLYDRFSFLSDVLPPSEVASGKTVQVGRGAATSGGFLRPQAVPSREKKAPQRTASSHGRSQAPKVSGVMKHPVPGEMGLKQTSLRF